ncbi:hypothetical protein ACFZDJ_14800 [Streptomyces sp. NPDC007896]|uniref:hypothetical protein n=1 Tax=Streptomyces sp. NPDC007896 TaxID=3364784 RepID=UPI0036E87F37
MKQKWAALAFQAFPRPWKRSGNWTSDEAAGLDALVAEFTVGSEHICERCGIAGVWALRNACRPAHRPAGRVRVLSRSR